MGVTYFLIAPRTNTNTGKITDKLKVKLMSPAIALQIRHQPTHTQVTGSSKV